MVKKRAVGRTMPDKLWKMPGNDRFTRPVGVKRSVQATKTRGSGLRSGARLDTSQILDLRGMTTREATRAIKARVQTMRNIQSKANWDKRQKDLRTKRGAEVPAELPRRRVDRTPKRKK